MRLLVCCLLLATVSAGANAHPANAPASAANLLRFHPGPWRMPAASMAGVRFDPETGEAAALAPATRAASARAVADARARAEASIRRLPDGSFHALANGAFRHWTVATIDEDGRLSEDCVHSQAEAQAVIDAAARKQVRK